jgi:hypothetical protein
MIQITKIIVNVYYMPRVSICCSSFQIHSFRRLLWYKFLIVMGTLPTIITCEVLLALNLHTICHVLFCTCQYVRMYAARVQPCYFYWFLYFFPNGKSYSFKVWKYRSRLFYISILWRSMTCRWGKNIKTNKNNTVAHVQHTYEHTDMYKTVHGKLYAS